MKNSFRSIIPDRSGKISINRLRRVIWEDFTKFFMISMVLYKAERKHIRCICAQDMVQWVNVEYDICKA